MAGLVENRVRHVTGDGTPIPADMVEHTREHGKVEVVEVREFRWVVLDASGLLASSPWRYRSHEDAEAGMHATAVRLDTSPEQDTLLAEAWALLHSARPDTIDQGLQRTWGRRRKALVNRLIDLGITR